MFGSPVDVCKRVLCLRCSKIKERRRAAMCNECRAEWQRIRGRSRFRKYFAELSPEERRAHYKKPQPTRERPEGCEICGGVNNRKTSTGERQSLCVDHCHKTGKFRGWLCNRCNLALGKLGDTVDGVKKALKYLEDAYGTTDE